MITLLRITIESVITCKKVNYCFQKKKWNIAKQDQSLGITSQVDFHPQKSSLIMYCFYFICSAINCYQAFYQCIKTNCKREGRGEVQDVVNMNNIKFELYGDQAISQYNGGLINSQDPQNQIENNKTTGAEYPNEDESEDTETIKTFVILTFMLNILPDDEIA